MRVCCWLASLALFAGVASASDLGETVRAGGLPIGGRPASGRAGALESPESDWLAEPFDAVLLQGQCPDASVEIEVSRQGASGAWGPWSRAYVRRRPGGRCWARARFPQASAGRLRLRATGQGTELFSVEVYRAEPPAGPEGPGRKEEPIDAGAPAIVSREAWGARPSREPLSPHVPRRFTQHHSAGRMPLGLGEAMEEMRFLQELHQDGRGWSDIGYHFVIDGAGRIFEGRPATRSGAHVRGANAGNLGVCLMGNYHPPYDHALTPAQRDALRRLGRWLRDAYGLTPDSYLGHRDYSRTDCPGDGVYPLLPSIREAIRAVPGPFARVFQGLGLERIMQALTAVVR
ncbi:MAG: N-acetylmuramoyl-L-alanine amidase [Elusimicrobia bacterium]|nr:N-acetylmuramoyl-L-alanine amidase [Elusimicrobiota bacterium]